MASTTTIFEKLVTQARQDTRLGPVEFRLFHAIVEVYRANPQECRLSTREWARIARIADGGVGNAQKRLEDLGYISITRLGHPERQSAYIQVLKDGKPVVVRGKKGDEAT